MDQQAAVGWRGISEYVSARAPFPVSIDSVMRCARRKVDPLPVRRFGTTRPRVYAHIADLDAWLQRQLRDEKEPGPA